MCHGDGGLDEVGSGCRNPREGPGLDFGPAGLQRLGVVVAIPVRGQAAKSIMIVACFDYLL